MQGIIAYAYQDPVQQKEAFLFSEQGHQQWDQLYQVRIQGQNKKWRTGFFVDLNGRLVAVNTNNFTNQFAVTNTNQFVHGGTCHFLGNND